MNDNKQFTSGETYFFRDHGQFDLLRLVILPELIERQRDRKTLRLWSAGCSSGEEAYSLAMLVDMLMPDRDDWRIEILGSDINRHALARCRHGHYGQWSFRMVPSTLKQRYFHPEGAQWVLDERIRRRVSFRELDLIQAHYPNGEIHDMDLILCRNVFIYFDEAEVKAVARKLAASLSHGGYLITGHTELIGHLPPQLQSRLYAQGVVYQQGQAQPTPVFSPVVKRPARPQPSGKISPPPLQAQRRLAGADEARKLADCGEYHQAEQASLAALASDPLAVAPSFLLAQLAQVRGDFDRARSMLNQTLYLDHRHVAAHLELAALCERDDDLPRAEALRHTALAIIRDLPADSIIDPYEVKAGDLAHWLAQWETVAMSADKV